MGKRVACSVEMVELYAGEKRKRRELFLKIILTASVGAEFDVSLSDLGVVVFLGFEVVEPSSMVSEHPPEATKRVYLVSPFDGKPKVSRVSIAIGLILLEQLCAMH